MQVEMDQKGRVLLPAVIRRKVGSRRFELEVQGDSIIIMRGLQDPESVRGKYRGLVKGKNMEQIEQNQEEFISKRLR